MAKTFYAKATVGDWVFSLILPFWGLVIGVSAIIFRKEKIRGLTMITIGIVELAIVLLISMTK